MKFIKIKAVKTKTIMFSFLEGTTPKAPPQVKLGKFRFIGKHYF